jgi:polysaccharide export outer membrane protein
LTLHMKIIKGICRLRLYLIAALIPLFLSGCKVFNASIMLQAPKDYAYDKIPDSTSKEFAIRPDDELSFLLFSNDGFRIVDITQSGGANMMATTNQSVTYRVEHDGTVKIPLLGRTKVADLTLRQAEMMLEEKYAAFFIKPFIILNIINRRVMVFPGSEGAAKMVNLTDNNTNIIQVLAMSGGIADRGKAHRIKLIRGDLKNPKVYLFDLSNIEGMKKADFVVQTNDIIYVEPLPRYARGVVAEIGPYLSLITTTVLTLTLINRLK